MNEIVVGSISFFKVLPATGWSQLTTNNDCALRITNSTISSGGSTGFSSIFTSLTPTGTVSASPLGGTTGGTSLSPTQVVYHRHNIGVRSYSTMGPVVTYSAISPSTVPYGVPYSFQGVIGYAVSAPGVTSSTGGSQAHSHPVEVSISGPGFTGNALNFSIKYVDLMQAQRI